MYALPHGAGHSVALLVCGFLILSCSGPAENSSMPPEEPAITQNAVENMARTFVTGKCCESATPPTANIAEIMEGGIAGEWGVRVDFPAGTGRGGIVEVVDKRSGDMLTRDSVDPTDDKSHSHVIRFRHTGRTKNLHVRVMDSKGGAILAESSDR